LAGLLLCGGLRPEGAAAQQTPAWQSSPSPQHCPLHRGMAQAMHSPPEHCSSGMQQVSPQALEGGQQTSPMHKSPVLQQA